jgi:hypothetical protein
MRLFTLDRANSLQENAILDLKNTDSSLPYWTTEGLFSEADLHEHLQTIFPEGLSMHGWKYAKERHTHGTRPNFSHNVSCLAEMNFEYVRKGFFADKPSRFQSMFACESIEEAKIFKEKFGNVDNKIYEIEGRESLRVDMSLILLGTQNVTGSFLAHKYWRGEAGTNPFWEHIVKLPVQVLREVT